MYAISRDEANAGKGQFAHLPFLIYFIVHYNPGVPLKYRQFNALNRAAPEGRLIILGRPIGHFPDIQRAILEAGQKCGLGSEGGFSVPGTDFLTNIASK
jgi:hypothetical protein